MRSLILTAMLLAVPTVAAAGDGWLTKCPYSHSNHDDPIKYPGQQGAIACIRRVTAHDCG